VFYTGQTNVVTAAVKQPHTTAAAGAEVRPFRRMRVIESFTTNRLHDVSGASEQITFLNPASAARSTFNERLVWNYSQPEVDVLSDSFRMLPLRGGYRYVWGDSRVPAPTLSQAGPFEDVELRQQIGLAGFTYRWGQKLSANFDFEGASSSHAYFRTSLYDYQ